MVRSNARVLRAVALGAVVALTLAACGTGNDNNPGASGNGSGQGTKGGTIYMLTQAEQWNRIDPQRAYTGEDLAFFGATIMRSLVSYKYSSDIEEANTLVPDLATDTGTANEDATEWKFTLREGVSWQDGSAITCEDVAYGVSRTFATGVISEGPTYQIAYLDIPKDPKDGTSMYKGPYPIDGKVIGQDLYDKAVTCDGNTITFKLAQSVPDFNYTTTLGFSPVPKDKDTGEKYDSDDVVSSGPYQIEEYSTGNGGKFILVRNENWSQASDPVRKAYPDRWEVNFGVDPKVMDQRLMQSTGNDAFAIQYGNIQPENLNTVFTDPKTTAPQFAGHARSGYDAYSLYYWINVEKVPDLKIRQAMAVALDREALRVNAGGAYAGDLADGAIKPNIGVDYGETGWATDLFGEEIPPTGNPDLAKRLIEESGKPAPSLTFDYPQTPVNDKAAAIVKSSLERVGFKVEPNPLEPGSYYSVVFDPDKKHEFGTGGWGPDWPNASTVIPPLFTHEGGWDLSEVEDKDFNARVKDAQTELDRDAQAAKWQELNKFAVEQAWIIPTRFNLTQVIAGTKVQPTYQWAPYSSWPYAEMYVTQ
jgi:peptide/nickel transport system substrate-binding protein